MNSILKHAATWNALVQNHSLQHEFHPYAYLVSIQKWPFFTISASICGVSCAAYHMYASAQPLDFLDFVKNCSFLNWTLAIPSI